MGVSSRAFQRKVSQGLGDAGYTSAFSTGRSGDGRYTQTGDGALRFIQPAVRGYHCAADGKAVLVRFKGRQEDEEHMLLRYLMVLDNLGYPAERRPDPDNAGRQLIQVTK